MSSTLQCKDKILLPRPICEILIQVVPSMSEFGKLLIALGAILILAGLVLTFLGRTNIPLGRLPGDILYRGKHTTFYFPLATSILLSVLLSLILYLVGRFRR